MVLFIHRFCPCKLCRMNVWVSFVYCIYLSLYVLLFCILTIFVYLYDFSTSDCYNLAFMLQDFNKCIHEKHHMQALIPFGMWLHMAILYSYILYLFFVTLALAIARECSPLSRTQPQHHLHSFIHLPLQAPTQYKTDQRVECLLEYGFSQNISI